MYGFAFLTGLTGLFIFMAEARAETAPQTEALEQAQTCVVEPTADPMGRPLPDGVEEYCLTIGALDRYFLSYKPATFKAGNPAVMVLHGGAGHMRRTFFFPPTARWKELSDEHGFLLISPNGVNARSGDTRGQRSTWNGLRPGLDNRRSKADDVSFLKAVAQWAVASEGANADKLYITGASNGGEMTMRMMIERPGLFAAGVPTIASLPATEVPMPSQGTPIMMINGTDDPLMPFEGGPVARVAEPVRSVDDTISFWIEANGLSPDSAKTSKLPDGAPDDGCRISRTDYAPSPDAAPVVVLVKAEGGGHTTPFPQELTLPERTKNLLGNHCRDIDGTELAWEFMVQH